MQKSINPNDGRRQSIGSKDDCDASETCVRANIRKWALQTMATCCGCQKRLRSAHAMQTPPPVVVMMMIQFLGSARSAAASAAAAACRKSGDAEPKHTPTEIGRLGGVALF
jgi:hypothetical protein